ncbi:hypothetical protein [Phormidium nigroviride]
MSKPRSIDSTASNTCDRSLIGNYTLNNQPATSAAQHGKLLTNYYDSKK